MSSSSADDGDWQPPQSDVLSDIPDSKSRKSAANATAQTSLISRVRNSGISKKAPRSKASFNAYCRANLPKPRRVPNKYEQRYESDDSSDDLPSVRPEGYKSPHMIAQDGDQIQMWWEGEDKFYPATVRNFRSDGKTRVVYDDGQVIYHFLDREVFIFVGKALERFLAICFPEDAEGHSNPGEPVPYPGLADFLEVGQRVRVYWHTMNEWYSGFITEERSNEVFKVIYDDDDTEVLKMKDETFRFVEESAAIVHSHLLEHSENRMQ